MAEAPSIPPEVPGDETAQSLHGCASVLSVQDDDDHSVSGADPVSLSYDLTDPETPSATSVSFSVDETPVSKMLAHDRAGLSSSTQLSPAAPNWLHNAQTIKSEIGRVGFSFMPANLKAVSTRPQSQRHSAIETYPQRSEDGGHRLTAPESISSARSRPSCSTPVPTDDGHLARVPIKSQCGNGSSTGIKNVESEAAFAAPPITQTKKLPDTSKDHPSPEENDIGAGKTDPSNGQDQETASTSATKVDVDNEPNQSNFDQGTGPGLPVQGGSAVRGPDEDPAGVTPRHRGIKTHTPSSPSDIRHRPKAVGRAPLHSSRVCKTPARHRPPPMRYRARPSHADTNPGNSRQPSEEDLLYMLMSRARETAAALDRLSELEEQNSRLARENELRGRALEEAVTAQDEQAQQQEILAQNLEGFKDKYYKLKKWALEANKDCEMLQTKAMAFRASLDDLIKDRDQVRAQLRHAQAASGQSSRQMHNIRSEIRDLNVVAQTTVSTIDRMDGLLLAQAEHLRSEKQKCRKLESHIVHIEHERNKKDSKQHSQNQELNEALQGISTRLAALSDRKDEETTREGQLMECQKMFQALLDKGLSTDSNMGALKDASRALHDHLNAQANSTSANFQAAIDALKEHLQQQTSAQVATLISQVQSGNKELIQAREEIASLRTKSEQTDKFLEVLRDGKSVAESREQYMHSTTERLMAALGDSKEAAEKQTVDFENRLSALLMKWQSACSQLAECKQQNEEKLREIREMKLELVEGEKNQQMLHQELEKSKKEVKEAQQHSERMRKDEADRMELQLQQLQGELNCEQEKQKVTEKEVGRLRSSHCEIQHRLEKCESERHAAVAGLQALQITATGLEEQLALAEQNKDSLKQANKCLEERTAEINHLRRCLQDYDDLKKEFVAQQRGLNEKDAEIRSSSEQVQQLQHRLAQVEEQVHEQQRSAEERKVLEQQIAATRQELSDMVGLKNELEQQNERVADLQSKLGTVQKAAAEAHELQGQNASLKEQIASLTSDLEGARRENAQLVALRGTVQAGENEIALLKEKLQASEALTDEVKGVKEGLRRKEEENATLQKQILELEDALSNAHLDRQFGPDENPRRAADRSGGAIGFPSNALLQGSGVERGQPLGFCYQADLVVLPHQLSVVPETQLDPLQEGEGEVGASVAQESPNREDSTSELSEYTSHGSDLEHDGNNLVRKKPATRQAQKQSQNTPGETDSIAQSHLQVMGRTPSSSYGSLNDQMLLDQVTQQSSQLDNHSHMASHADGDRDHILVNNDGEDTLRWAESVAMPIRSPNGLTSGPRTQRRESTPFPDSPPEPRTRRDATPAIMRERYQPNSAAKRRVEYDEDKDEYQGQARRLKRRPANLDIRPPRGSTPKPQSGQQTAPRVALSSRKSSSVVGTNAPAPGRSQRTSKPARRGSRQDKYTTRFAA